MNAITFFKYQGTGNDFIMVDDRRAIFDPEDHALIAHLCHRKFGIGADGLILIRNHEAADFEMIYYNSDGHLTSLCGNGSRCAVKFSNQLGIVRDRCKFMTSEGILHSRIEGDLVYVKMPDVDDIEKRKDHYFLYTGSPHHVCFVRDVERHDVFREGRKIRFGAPYFKEGSNVNFVQQYNRSEIFVRTYERGVENETLSCGTGVTAAALVLAMEGATSPVKVKTLGGELHISFEKKDGHFKNIFLSGPAVKVFEGKYLRTPEN
ncbi:MAG: diaminopimelate epimerase [Cytophagales bacterium]|nr:diaminopimelate epimerase [Cytophagales bacterium]